MKYRVRKQVFSTNSTWPEEEYDQPEVIISFAVQVKDFLFWHTVKEFKEIRKANELLSILKQEV
jgi:hypothetical protein